MHTLALKCIMLHGVFPQVLALLHIRSETSLCVCIYIEFMYILNA